MIKSIDFPYEFTPFQKSYLTQTLFIKKLNFKIKLWIEQCNYSNTEQSLHHHIS